MPMKLKETWETVQAIPNQLKAMTVLVILSAVLSVITFVMMIGMASHAH